MIKACYLFILSILLATNACASENISSNTPVSKNQWYIGPIVGAISIKQDIYFAWGLAAEWLRSRRFYLGVSSFSLDKPIKSTRDSMSSIGVYAGMRFNTSYNFQYSLDIMSGSGDIRSYYERDNSPDSFTFVQPRFNLNFPLNPISELFTSLSYRHVSDSTHAAINNADLSGINISLTLVFGKF